MRRLPAPPGRLRTCRSKKRAPLWLLATGVGAACLFSGASSAVPPLDVETAANEPPPPDFQAEVARIHVATDDATRVTLNTATGYARFVTFSRGGLGLDPAQGAEASARVFLEDFGGIFGVVDASDLVLESNTVDARTGMRHLRYGQVYKGVPVLDAQVRIHFWPNGHLRGVNGTFVPDVDLDETPGLSAAAATAYVDAAIASELGGEDRITHDGAPELFVYRENLNAGKPGPNRLVWKVATRFAGSRELVYVDAESGALVDRRSTVAHGIERRKYLPGCNPHATCGPFGPTCYEDPFSVFRCSDNDEECPSEANSECYRTCDDGGDDCAWEEGDTLPFECDGNTPNCPSADEQEIEDTLNALIRYTEDAYDFFSCVEGADLSWDLTTDGQMHGMIEVDVSCAEALFFFIDDTPPVGWTHICATEMADDIGVHEWAHGYSFTTHDLNLTLQPGALSESTSDIWGEVVDLINGEGEDGEAEDRTVGNCSEHDSATASDPSDEDSYRWLIAEDSDENLRDMWTPTCLGDPGKVSDAEYSCVGDIHGNGGVTNHAFSLLVDGGTYNGETVAGIGLSKAASIYWRAQRIYQSSTTTFADHADALVSACDDLVGISIPSVRTCANNITMGQSDCDSVEDAIRAVEMCSTVCEDCPATTTCPGPYCTDGDELSSVDKAIDRCKLPSGQMFECDLGDNINTVTYECDRDACCEGSPPTCICCASGATKVALECEAAQTALCLAYP